MVERQYLSNESLGGKLLPSHSSSHKVRRKRLIARLLEARRQRAVVIQGPAGAGKTTVAAELREALTQLSFDVVWFSVSPDDNKVLSWVSRLLASFERVRSDYVSKSSAVVEDGDDYENVERVVVSLLRRIEHSSRQVTLVIDNLHHLTRPSIIGAIQCMLDHAPDNLHLLLITRSALSLSLSRLRDRKQSLELDFRDLRFSIEESEEFLTARLGNVDRRDLRRLHEITEGWIAGLQILSGEWKKKRDKAGLNGPRGFRQSVKLVPPLSAYFEREVLSRLEVEEVGLLVRAAACDRLCAPLCAALMARSDGADEAALLLRRLARDSLFVWPADGVDRQKWYRLHPMLGEVLRARFDLMTASERRQVHAAAWIWFRDRGYLDQAVQHAVSAGEASPAASLLEKIAPELVEKGQLRKLVRLIRALPADEIERRTELRFWETRFYLYARELDECTASIQRLEADIPTRNVTQRFSLVVLRANLALQRDNIDEAITILPKLQRMPQGADSLTVGGRNNFLSWVNMHCGNYEQSRRVLLDEPPPLSGDAPLTEAIASVLQGRCLMGLSYALEGHMVLAERVYRDVLREAEQHRSTCAHQAHLASALLGEVLYEINDPMEAISLLEERVDILERGSIPDSVLRIFLVLSAAHWLANRHSDAFAYLERLQDYATRMNLDRLLAHSLGMQIHRHLLRREFDVSQHLLGKVSEVAARHPRAATGTFGEISLIVEQSRMRWDIALGNYDQAAECVSSLVAQCEEQGRQQLVVQLQLQSAVVDFRRGRALIARDTVLNALQRGRRLGLMRSILDADSAIMEMVDALVSEREQDPLLTFYMERLRRANATALNVASAHDATRETKGVQSPKLSDREAEILHLLGQALPNKKIARALHLSPDTVRWHLKNIYGKLDVSTRDEAVARMRDISSTDDH